MANKGVIQYHRRKKNLCQKCGTVEEGVEHDCIEDYSKADRRSEKKNNQDNQEKRKKTIQNYRWKKGLCEFCGQEQHDGDCVEDYSQTDLREEKTELKTISTPKYENNSILQKLLDEKVNKIFVSETQDPFFQLKSQTEINQENYIAIDITPEREHKIAIDFIEFLNNKYKSSIIYLFGEPEKVFSCYDSAKLRKTPGLSFKSNISDLEKINYLSKCKRLFSLPSKYCVWCMINNIPVTVFTEEENQFDSSVCRFVTIDKSEIVDLDAIKRTTLSYKV